jgi:hypothetical protein
MHLSWRCHTNQTTHLKTQNNGLLIIKYPIPHYNYNYRQNIISFQWPETLLLSLFMTNLHCNGIDNRDTIITINVMVAVLFYFNDNKQNVLDQEMFFQESRFAYICGH